MGENELSLFSNETAGSKEKKMSVQEVADVLGVTAEAIKKHIRELYPEILKNGVKTYLNERQVTEIKQRMIPTTEVVGATTDYEMELMTTKELAAVLGVDVSTVTNTVRRLNATSDVLPKFKQGQTPRYDEKQATLIKQEIQKHHNLQSRQIDSVSTELEENETIANAIMILQRRNEELRKRAEVAENSLARLTNAQGEKSVKEVAKILGYGEKNFFALMRGMGIFFYDNGINLPKQEYINSGYFIVKTENYTRNGVEYTYTRIFVTAKGLVWLEKKTKAAA